MTAASNYLPVFAALRDVALTAPNPWPGAMLSIAFQVAQVIATAKTAAEEYSLIAIRLTEVLAILVPALSKSDLVADPALSISISNVIRTLEVLGRTVEKQLSKGKIQSFLSTSSSKLAVRQASQSFEIALEGLFLSLALSNLRISSGVKPVDFGAIKEQVEIARREQLDVIREEVQRIESTRNVLSGHSLPANSHIFDGRQKEVDHAPAILVGKEQSTLAILGSGGIGKTSLALALMHHPSTIEHFEKRRYFISCDAVNTPEALSERFAQELGLGRGRPLPELKKLASEVNRPILITFDNFETPWEPSDTRAKLEEFLSDLMLIPQVSLVVTLRGAERPAGIAWSKPFLPPLQPLDMEPAIRVFTTISDTAEDDPYMHQLITAVEMVPLAITLIATQAQYVPCQELLRMWEEQKTSMVSRGYDGRLSSLDVSIRVSLESSRFKQEPAAERLLQLLSILPDGASDSLLTAMTEEGFPLHVASATLLRVSLAFRDNQGLLRALSPVREYMMSHYPISGRDLSMAFRHLQQVGDHYMEVRGKAEAEEMSKNWTPQFGNLRCVIEHCLARTADIPPLHSTDTAWKLHYVLWGAVGQASLDAWLNSAAYVAHASGLTVQEARLFIACDKKTADRGRLINFLIESGDPELVLTGWREKGNDYHYAQLRPLEALRAIEEAKKVIERVPTLSENNVVTYYLSTYPIMMQLARPVEALQMLRMAMETAEANGLVQYIAPIHESLSELERLRGCYSKGLYHVYTALSGRDQPNVGLARAIMNLVDLIEEKGELQEAGDTVLVSYKIFQQLGRLGDWGAAAQKILVTAYAMTGRFLEAEAVLEQYKIANQFGPKGAIRLSLLIRLASKSLAEAQQEAKRLCAGGRLRRDALLIGDAEFLQGNVQDALVNFVLALSAARSMDFRLGVAMVLFRFGDVFRTGDHDMETALNCYQAAFNLVGFIGANWHIADILVRIGVSQAYFANTASALMRLYQAQKLFRRVGSQRGVEICDQLIVGLDRGVERSTYLSPDIVPQPSFVGWLSFR